MKLKGIVMEDFVNFMKPSLFLITSMCDWKCCKELSIPITVCQNEPIAIQETKEFSNELIYKAYVNNDITQAICIGGLEPMLQIDEVFSLIEYFRNNGCNDTFVIYTGYNEDETINEITRLKQFVNVIIKFGRFIPGQEKHLDQALGVYLASDNQYGKRIS